MNLQDAKMLSNLKDRELLETLLASQILIHRTLDDIQYKLDNMDIKEVPPEDKVKLNNFNDTLDDMVNKIPRFIDGLNEYLEGQNK